MLHGVWVQKEHRTSDVYEMTSVCEVTSACSGKQHRYRCIFFTYYYVVCKLIIVENVDKENKNKCYHCSERTVVDILVQLHLSVHVLCLHVLKYVSLMHFHLVCVYTYTHKPS